MPEMPPMPEFGQYPDMPKMPPMPEFGQYPDMPKMPPMPEFGQYPDIPKIPAMERPALPESFNARIKEMDAKRAQAKQRMEERRAAMKSVWEQRRAMHPVHDLRWGSGDALPPARRPSPSRGAAATGRHLRSDSNHPAIML